MNAGATGVLLGDADGLGEQPLDSCIAGLQILLVPESKARMPVAARAATSKCLLNATLITMPHCHGVVLRSTNPI